MPPPLLRRHRAEEPPAPQAPRGFYILASSSSSASDDDDIDDPHRGQQLVDAPPPPIDGSKASAAVPLSATVRTVEGHAAARTSTPGVSACAEINPQSASTTFPVFDPSVPVRNRPCGLPPKNVLEIAVRAGARHPLAFSQDPHAVTIYDGFPKATVHLLVLPRDTSLRRVSALRPGSPTHVAVVRHLHAVGEALIRHLQSTTHPGWHFQCGFHAAPSLEPLHMHVTSMDFEASPNVKNKRHYASFAHRSHFVPVAEVLSALEGGRVPPSRSSAEGKPVMMDDLACLWCGTVPPNLPALKAHLATCARRQAKR